MDLPEHQWLSNRQDGRASLRRCVSEEESRVEKRTAGDKTSEMAQKMTVCDSTETGCEQMWEKIKKGDNTSSRTKRQKAWEEGV